MSISAISPIGSGLTYGSAPAPVAIATVAAPEVLAEQSAVTAAAAALDTTTTTATDTDKTPAPAPFANPAIDEIAREAATAAALGGDSGLLVQSYGAVALVTATIALSQIFPDANGPAVTAPARVESIYHPALVA